MIWELEEIARLALEHADASAVVDPHLVAERHGLEVRTAPGCTGVLIGHVVIVDDALRAQRRAFAIAHELAHHLLREAGSPNTEARANYLAAALLLPRLDFEADLRRLGWDLLALCARHRAASFEAVARRIVALRDARAFVFDKPLDGQRRPRWYSVPRGHRPSAHELDAAREAATCGAPVCVVAGVTAWPVLEHDWHRVITLTA
jgi:hypothetical protein